MWHSPESNFTINAHELYWSLGHNKFTDEHVVDQCEIYFKLEQIHAECCIKIQDFKKKQKVIKSSALHITCIRRLTNIIITFITSCVSAKQSY